MKKLKLFDYLFFTIAFIGIIAAIFSTAPIYLLLLFVCLSALYLELSIFGYFLIVLMILDASYFIDYLYVLFIGYYVYLNWIESKRPLDRVVVVDLHKYHQQYYANVLLIIIALNLLMLVISGGFSVLFSSIALLSILVSTFKIFSCWMISKRIFEASYFYLAFLISYIFRTIILVEGWAILSIQPYLIVIFITLIVLTLMYITRNILANKRIN